MLNTDQPQGSITCIMGPMFSGKTTELIRRCDRYRIAKKKCILVKYAGDTRYDANLIITHQRNVAQGATLKANRLSEVISAIFHPATEVVAIDEGQFFDDLSITCDKLANAGKTVIVAALDGSFQRKPFSQVSQLLPFCNEITKLQAVCMSCGSDAPFTYRDTNDTQVEFIGGSDVYRALCRLCYHENTQQKCEYRNSRVG